MTSYQKIIRRGIKPTLHDVLVDAGLFAADRHATGSVPKLIGELTLDTTADVISTYKAIWAIQTFGRIIIAERAGFDTGEELESQRDVLKAIYHATDAAIASVERRIYQSIEKCLDPQTFKPGP